MNSGRLEFPHTQRLVHGGGVHSIAHLEKLFLFICKAHTVCRGTIEQWLCRQYMNNEIECEFIEERGSYCNTHFLLGRKKEEGKRCHSLPTHTLNSVVFGDCSVSDRSS